MSIYTESDDDYLSVQTYCFGLKHVAREKNYNTVVCDGIAVIYVVSLL